MKTIEPLVKWSGTKRSLAYMIIKHFPFSFGTYYEPFVGGGSILYALNPSQGFFTYQAICGDICSPLIALWKVIQTNPQQLIKEYTKNWQRLQVQGQSVYYEVRDRFNETQSAEDFLFLTRTCVNGLIRFNQKGEFNNSFHHTRSGIVPNTLKKVILKWHFRVKKVTFICADYRETMERVAPNDLVYLDPPYLQTKGMYYGGINFTEFKKYLKELTERQVKFVLSLDGTQGDNEFIHPLPETLYKRHFLLESGLSTFPKVNRIRQETVYESLYLNF